MRKCIRETLQRKVAKNPIAVNEDITKFYTVFFCPQSSQITRIMGAFSHEEIAFTAAASSFSGSLAAVQCVRVCLHVLARSADTSE